MNEGVRIAAAALLALTACGDERGASAPPRPPPVPIGACLCVVGGVWVGVVDASTGAAVPNASASISGPSCTADSCTCSVFDPAAPQIHCSVPDGSFIVTAQAPGYAPAQAPANVAPIAALPCCQQPTTVTIALSR